MAENPIQKLRKANRMTVERFAGAINISVSSARAGDLGRLMDVPERWRAGVEGMGWDFNVLAEDYRAYKVARAREVVAKWNERQGK